MKKAIQYIEKQGIKLNSYEDGQQKVICPECSHIRKNKTEPCLSVNINSDTILWKCHHCEWQGGMGNNNENLHYT